MHLKTEERRLFQTAEVQSVPHLIKNEDSGYDTVEKVWGENVRGSDFPGAVSQRKRPVPVFIVATVSDPA